MRPILAIVALLAAAGIAVAVLRPNEHQRMQREIASLDRQMPMVNGEVKMTHIALDKMTVKSWYAIAATFETDPETSAAVRKVLVKQACADTKFHEMLTQGYTFDNVVAVDTPHGPGQFDISIRASDC